MTNEIEEHNEPERERKGDPSIETSSLQYKTPGGTRCKGDSCTGPSRARTKSFRRTNRKISGYGSLQKLHRHPYSRSRIIA